MDTFAIAILISIVLKYLSGIVVRLYLSKDKTPEELSKSIVFNLAVLSFVINDGLILINGSILAALMIKTYIL